MQEINGFPGYFVTRDGKVYSNRKYSCNPKGELREKKCPIHYRDKYRVVTLQGRTFAVHRLVAQAYIPQPPNCNSVNHIDENKLNNHVDNLEWLNIDANNAYSKLNLYVVENKSGETFQVDNMRAFCHEHNLDRRGMLRTAKGQQNWCQGYRIVSKRKASTEERDAYVSAAILSATTG